MRPRRDRVAKRTFLLGASLAALAASAFAQSVDRAADMAAIRAVIQAFIDTRDANDANALTAILTADADQQLTSGSLRSGREAVVSGSLSTTRSTGGKRTISVDRLRFIGEDVAIADGRYDSVGRADGSDLHMLTTIVLRRDGGAWKIAAIRNMVPTTPAR